MELDSAPPKKAENKLSCPQRIEIFLQHLVSRAGFFGILLCASVNVHFLKLDRSVSLCSGIVTRSIELLP